MTSSYFQNPGEIARKLRESSVDTDEMRQYLFERARDTGLLDEGLEDDALNNASWDVDDTYEPDIEDLRNSADISNYRDDIPFSRNVEIDPDYETYNAFRLAGENPKIRQAIESGESLVLGDLDTNREALYQALQSGRLSSEDLAVLRDAGRSRVLDGSGYGSRERDAVNDILQGVTRSDVDYMPAIEAVGDVIADIDDVVEPVARATSNRRNLINQLTSTQVSDPLGVDLRGGRQLGLPLNRSANIEQALSRAEELPATYAELRNEIADLSQLVGSTRGFSAVPPTPSADSSVLPQVRALFPNQFDLQEAVGSARRAQAASQEERNALYNVQRRLSDEGLRLQREQNQTERALDRSPTDIDLQDIQIPGLRLQLLDTVEKAQEEETNRGIAKFREFVEKYPEVGPYLQSPIKSEAKKPERDLNKLERFTDTTQQISKPEDRAELYKTMQSELGIPIEGIAQLEQKYVSGEPSQQKEVIDYIARLGYGDALSAISQSAVSKRAPVVGGGGYAFDDEKKELQGYIDKRQADYQKMMNSLPFSARRAMESRRPSSMGSTPSEMRFGYDPDTGEAYRDPQGEYGISLRTGSAPSSFSLADVDFGVGGASKNVLRYLAENPITNLRSISFETAAPGWRGYNYEPKEIPAPVFKEMEKFIKNNVMQNMTPGTLISNSPIDTSDIIESLENRGKTAEDSSMLRRSEVFTGKQPNRRAGAYRSVGFGPLVGGSQYAYVNAEGNIVPLQTTSPTASLRGNLRIEPTRTTETKTTPGSLAVTQSREPLTSKAYFSTDPVTAVPQGVQEYLRAVRRTPAALLPGAADLIPSPEAIQTGYREGALPMAKQMGQEFVQSLPQAVAASSVLSAVPPLAPGVGLGMVGTAGARALNEVVRQETGEGIVPKLRQVIGTAPRTGVASPARTTPYVTPQVRPLNSAQRAEMQRLQNRNEIQRRVDLVKERFNPRKGEFGLSEILLGR
jgi:hypothetical protein